MTQATGISKEGNRIVYLDILRVMAVFFVIMLHISSANWHGVGVNTYEWRMMNLFDSVSRWCVPVLAMISGSLFLNRDVPLKKIFGKYILRLGIAYIVWSFAYSFIYNIILKRDLSAFFGAFIQGNFHMWFILMIIGMYMITPFLRRIIVDDHLTRYFVLLAIIVAVAIPQAVSIVKVFSAKYGEFAEEFIDKFHLKFVLGFTVYYMMGYHLSNATLSRKATAMIYVLGVIGFLSTIICTLLISMKLDKPVSVFYDNHSVNVFLESVAVFMLVKNTAGKKRISSKTAGILSALSKYSFGAYLVHAFILSILSKFLHLNSLSFNPLLSVPLTAVVAFIVSFGISAVLNHIPVVKKYLV